MSKRWVNAIYCEDVRNELGGKTSLMGIFASEMIVPVFPATIPRLVAMVKLRTPSDELPKTVRFVIYRDDEVLAESSTTTEDMGLLEDGSEDKSAYLVCFFAFGALAFTKPVQIRLRAICDGEEIVGNALMVREATTAESTTFGFSRPEAAPARPAKARSRKTAA